MACVHATKAAMAHLVDTGKVLPRAVRTLAGFSVSGFGIGCYRMGNAHKDALVYALPSEVVDEAWYIDHNE